MIRISELKPGQMGWAASYSVHMGQDGYFYLDPSDFVVEEEDESYCVRISREESGFTAKASKPRRYVPESTLTASAIKLNSFERPG